MVAFSLHDRRCGPYEVCLLWDLVVHKKKHGTCARSNTFLGAPFVVCGAFSLPLADLT